MQNNSGSITQELNMNGEPSLQLTPEAPLGPVASADTSIAQQQPIVKGEPESFSDIVKTGGRFFCPCILVHMTYHLDEQTVDWRILPCRGMRVGEPKPDVITSWFRKSDAGAGCGVMQQSECFGRWYLHSPAFETDSNQKNHHCARPR